MSKSWGTPTWYFFHSLAEHISENLYNTKKLEVCNIIKMVCSNLPCPECRQHAVLYTKSLTPRNVPTKKHLQDYLFNFHNSVNMRLNKGQFRDYDKYKLSKLEHIFKLFNDKMIHNRYNNRKFNETLSRKNMMHQITNFLNTNKNEIRWL